MHQITLFKLAIVRVAVFWGYAVFVAVLFEEPALVLIVDLEHQYKLLSICCNVLIVEQALLVDDDDTLKASVGVSDLLTSTAAACGMVRSRMYDSQYER
jgi:hypothetical protein